MASSSEYKLWYWPAMKGRGEYVRLMFEDAGVPYYDVGRAEGPGPIMELVFQGKRPAASGTAPLFPVRAPPLLQHGPLFVCNTPVICNYLGREWGWTAGLSKEEVVHVEQTVVVVADAVGEGRMAFHPTGFYSTHKGQEEASLPYRKEYGEQRLPKYIAHFEAILACNPHPGGFLIGPGRTQADLSVYHYLCAAEQHYKEHYLTCMAAAPKLTAFKTMIAERPALKAYWASERCPPWDTDSMM